MHVHVGRFVGLLVLMAGAGSLGFYAHGILLTDPAIPGSARPITEILAGITTEILMLALFATRGLWLPAAVLTVAWAGWERGEP